ncbi:hypothetical protein EJ02DRAFT_133057 [Clathrospora elynae]|uniref:Uncharacterized protein n=1 Tax=Clathrospora elynae TaxID=706981 RepID=A0A6A5SU63_9PLEO|nr:hypothetical protein EJ02DRAFT_133057 [Clathrospora elynae]
MDARAVNEYSGSSVTRSTPARVVGKEAVWSPTAQACKRVSALGLECRGLKDHGRKCRCGQERVGGCWPGYRGRNAETGRSKVKKSARCSQPGKRGSRRAHVDNFLVGELTPCWYRY